MQKCLDFFGWKSVENNNEVISKDVIGVKEVTDF